VPEGKNWVPKMVENTFKSHGERSELDMGWFNTFQCMERRVSRTVSASCRESDDTLRDQAREFYLFGSRKVDVSSTNALYVYGVSCSFLTDDSHALLQHTSFPVSVGFNRRNEINNTSDTT